MYYWVWIKSGGFFQTIAAQPAFLNTQPQQPAHPGRWRNKIQDGSQCLVAGKLTEQNGSNAGWANGQREICCAYMFTETRLRHTMDAYVFMYINKWNFHFLAQPSVVEGQTCTLILDPPG